MVKFPKVGDVVIFHDPVGTPFTSLVTAVWAFAPNGETEGEHCAINVVYVSDDETKKDNYGRQIGRNTSVPHGSGMPAHGMYWRYDHEAPNDYNPAIK